MQEVEKNQDSGTITDELTYEAAEELERLKEIEQRWRNIEAAEVNGYDLTERDQERLSEYEDEFESIDEVSDKMYELQNDANNYKLDENGDTKFSQYQLPGGENYKEVLLTMPSKRYGLSDEGIAKRESNTFRSSHFDEPNILAHVRFNERTDSEGNKVLFLEEIQSDWAQKGKKEGFESSKKGAE